MFMQERDDVTSASKQTPISSWTWSGGWMRISIVPTTGVKQGTKVVEKSEAQPSVISMSDMSSQGVVVDLAQILAMLLIESGTMVGEDTQHPGRPSESD